MTLPDLGEKNKISKRKIIISPKVREQFHRLMGKMIRSDNNTIRPRKNVDYWMNTIEANRNDGKSSVFKISENNFSLNVPPPLSNNRYADATKLRHRAGDNSSPNRKDGMKKRIKQQLESYCDKTTLHGLRYVGDSSLSLGERVFWLISFSLAITFAAYYITNIYDKWKSSPVIISFSPFDADLSSIPFPAITICNMNQAKKSEAEKILAEGTNVEKKLLDDSCNGNATYDGTENIGWESVRNFLVKVGNSCSDMLKQCTWRSDKIDCEEAFNNDLTDEGLCCSFNRLPPDTIFRNSKDISILNQTYPDKVYNWNPEKGFVQKEDGTEYIPRRPLGAGSHLGLSIILDAQVDNYYCSSTKSVGFKVLLSNPIETPKMADFAFLITPGIETRIAIDPSIREATESLRDIPIEKRQCYFANERPLQYYRTYSLKNCQLECQTRFTLQWCGCAPYYLPRKNTTKICDFDDPCIQRAKVYMDQLGTITYMNGTRVNCTCLQSCSNIHYTSKKTYSNLYQETPVENMNPAYFAKNTALIHFYFASSKYSKVTKKALYTVTDVLGSTGGLLGIFLGFSFLSFFEMVFFLVWKMATQATQFKERNAKDLPNTTVLYPYVEVYTHKSCVMECQSNYTLMKCDCVPYYLPKNKAIRFCGKTEKSCILNAKEDIELATGNGTISQCKCLPGCDELSYDNIKTSFSKLSAKSTQTINEEDNTTMNLLSYTQKNCNHECQSNYTYRTCKCIPYYLPKNTFIRFCGKSDKVCVEQASEDMEITYGNGSSCGCLPGCFQVNYSKSKSYGTLSDNIPREVFRENVTVSYYRRNIAVLHFFFSKSKFNKELKTQLYTFTEILSNVGGLLGLCMGFSFLSVVEIVYFFILRLICRYLRRHCRNQKAGKNTDKDKTSVYPYLK